MSGGDFVLPGKKKDGGIMSYTHIDLPNANKCKIFGYLRVYIIFAIYGAYRIMYKKTAKGDNLTE